MQNIGLLLLAFATVAAIIAIWHERVGSAHMGWAAVALWILSELVGGIGRSAFLH